MGGTFGYLVHSQDNFLESEAIMNHVWCYPKCIDALDVVGFQAGEQEDVHCHIWMPASQGRLSNFATEDN